MFQSLQICIRHEQLKRVGLFIYFGKELSMKIVRNQVILHFSTAAKAFRDISAFFDVRIVNHILIKRCFPKSNYAVCKGCKIIIKPCHVYRISTICTISHYSYI